MARVHGVAITVDLHDSDSGHDIVYAADWLAGNGIPATFFVPSAMLDASAHRIALRRVAESGHEMASHSHRHDTVEVEALRRGGAALAFLQESKERHADFFGTPPRVFRSPAWCRLGPAALDELHRLEYHADSSATPQRLGVLSSTPYGGVWTTSRRTPHYLRDGLLEVPTSTFLVPAASPTFQTFREELSVLFVRTLVEEARVTPRQVLVLQFHAADFNPAATHHAPNRPLGRGDFILRRRGGFGFKHHLRLTDAGRIAALTHRLLLPMSVERCLTLSDCVRLHRGETAQRT